MRKVFCMIPLFALMIGCGGGSDCKCSEGDGLTTGCTKGMTTSNYSSKLKEADDFCYKNAWQLIGKTKDEVKAMFYYADGIWEVRLLGGSVSCDEKGIVYEVHCNFPTCDHKKVLEFCYDEFVYVNGDGKFVDSKNPNAKGFYMEIEVNNGYICYERKYIKKKDE